MSLRSPGEDPQLSSPPSLNFPSTLPGFGGFFVFGSSDLLYVIKGKKNFLEEHSGD